MPTKRTQNVVFFFLLKGCFSNQDGSIFPPHSLVVAACAVCLVHSRSCVSFRITNRYLIKQGYFFIGLSKFEMDHWAPSVFTDKCCLTMNTYVIFNFIVVVILKKSENQVMFCPHTGAGMCVENWRVPTISLGQPDSGVLVLIMRLGKLFHCDWLGTGQFINF